MTNHKKSGLWFYFLLVLTCFLFSWLTVRAQFSFIRTNYGNEYIETTDFSRHMDRINGTADSPYRFRMLTDVLLEAVRQMANPGADPRLPGNYDQITFYFRLTQNLLIFGLAFFYFQTLGISQPKSILGILVVAYGMSMAFYQSDMSFYTYSEIVFLLAAGILINLRRLWWLIPLTVIATLNREGAIFIPIMLVASEWSKVKFKLSYSMIKQIPLAGFLSFAAFAITYIGIHAFLGPAPYAESRYGTVSPGITLLFLNLVNVQAWIGLLKMYTVLPIALFFFKSWGAVLRYYFFFLALPWFFLNFVFGSADETRLFLVPLLLVFIPALMQLLPKKFLWHTRQPAIE